MTDIFGALRFRSRKNVRSPCPLTPFPPLPTEIVRYILELIAEDRSAAFNLTLVSKSVQNWIIPLLYHTVTLTSSEEVIRFHEHVAAIPQVASQVKNLSMRCLSHSSANSLMQILRDCTQLERLVLDSLCRKPLDLSTLQWPAPQEVVFIYGAGSWFERSYPIFRNVTHLHLDDVLFQSTLEACKHSCLRLTHLGISHHHTHNNVVNGDNFVRLIRWLLSSTPSLEMVLLHSVRTEADPLTLPLGVEVAISPDFSDRVWGELAKIEDERLLVRPGLGRMEYSNILKSGSSIWDDASTRFGDWRKFT